MSAEETGRGSANDTEIIADFRRTYEQLIRGTEGASGVTTWSMRLTLEEMAALLRAVDERDDLKRRLLSDWEPDLPSEYPMPPVVFTPNKLAEHIAQVDAAASILAEFGSHHVTVRDVKIGATAKTTREFIDSVEARTYADPENPNLTSKIGCPRRDTIHDCPLGGCADASPRPSEIPDVPAADLKPHVDLMNALAKTLASRVAIGRESRETPPDWVSSSCRWCKLPIQRIRGAWSHIDLSPEEDAKHHPAEPIA